jgi:phosphohistidine phosphatase
MSAKLLYLLRHAQAVTDPSRYVDHDRPLHPSGEEHAHRIGQWLTRNSTRAPRTVVSSAARTQATAALVLSAFSRQSPQIITDARLYASSPSTILDIIRETPPSVDALMIVGHNPEISILARQFSDDIGECPTGGLVIIELSTDDWANVSDAGVMSARLQLI